MASNINRVTVTGNLTRDPEVKSTSGGSSVCKIRLACNTRKKNRDSGQWEDSPNYFDVVCFGAQAENCGKYLAKGRPIAVDGRLEWSEWEKDGDKRQAVQIIADTIQFLGGGEEGGRSSSVRAEPVDTSDFTPATSSDDDIPF